MKNIRVYPARAKSVKASAVAHRPRDGMAVTPPRIVGLLMALSVASYLNRTVLSIASPTLMVEFGLSEVAMGGVYLRVRPQLCDHHGTERMAG